MKPIILASFSPRRKELLSLMGLNFKVIGSNYEEELDLNLSPHNLVKYLSLKKAENVAQRFKKGLIIAADTLVFLDGKPLGKPHTKKKAKEMLRLIRGRDHFVITGFSIIDNISGKLLSESVETKVYVKNITDKEIDNYVKTGEPLDKAGGYAIQGLGSLIINKIEGDYFNVVGLPLSSLFDALKKFGIRLI